MIKLTSFTIIFSVSMVVTYFILRYLTGRLPLVVRNYAGFAVVVSVIYLSIHIKKGFLVVMADIGIGAGFALFAIRNKLTMKLMKYV